MGLSMKNFSFLGVHWKIRLLGWEFVKNWYREGLPKKGGAWIVSRFEGGSLARKRVVVFLRGGSYPDAHNGNNLSNSQVCTNLSWDHSETSL